MYIVIIGIIAAIYCAFWFIRGLDGGRIPDNLFRMIDRRDERHKVMLGAYGVGLLISIGIIILGI